MTPEAEGASGFSIPAGYRIGGYQVEAPLGAGGMGVVFRAIDTKLNRPVAIKFLSDELADAAARRRFQREAQTASSLNHPHIVTVYDVGEVDGRQYLVTEFVDGGTLGDWAKATRRTWRETIELLTGVADGLAAAHAAGLVHRDIKPANILVAKNGYAKLADFGLAKLWEATDLTMTRTLSAGHTRPGMVVGTLAYMSPEQAAGQPVDARSDIFSFGIVLYEMLAGRRPFEGATGLERLQALMSRPAPPLTESPLELPADLRNVVEKALEKDPAARYQTARELVIDLRRLTRETATAQPGPAAARGNHWKVIISAAAAVLVFSVAGYVYYHRSPTLTDKDTIVLADFDNKTGDPVFDDTLRRGLSVDLQQSPFLSLLSDRQVQQQLALMGQPKDARLTSDVAQQVCERTASAMVLEGSIASLGSQYVLGLRARNCNTGTTVDEEQVQVGRREDVLNALSQVGRKFRTQVGESLATVEKHSMPLQEATTPSLEALQAYSAGIKAATSAAGNDAGMAFLRRAVEIDPQFAIAYANLGLGYSGLGESVLSAENATRAWQLRERASDREKFFIEFTYHRQVTGNLEKAYQTLESWLQTYPRGDDPPSPHDLLGGLSAQGTGRFERAIEISQREIATHPDVAFGYGNLASSFFFLDRFPDAESALQQAYERKLENVNQLVMRYTIALLTGDKDQRVRVAARAKGKRGAEYLTAHAEALDLARSGHLQAARLSSNRAQDLAVQEGAREAAASYQAARAVWEAVCGNLAEGKRNAMAALDISKGRDVQYTIGLALAFTGDFSRSEAIAGDLEKRFPEDTFVKFTYAPVLRGLAALARGKPSDSVEHLQVAVPYDLAANGLNFNHVLGGLYSAYVRGEALLALHRYPEAAAEFQKILDHRGIVGADPIGALTHLQLGRTFVLSGEMTKAKAAYQDFLTLWKDADPDVPILTQARAEYAKLQ